MKKDQCFWKSIAKRFYPIEIALLASWIALVGSAWAFLAIGNEMCEGEFVSYDTGLLQTLRLPGDPHTAVGPTWLTEVMRDLTALGGTTVLMLVLTFATTIFLTHRRRVEAIILVASVVLARLSTAVFKDLYSRPRPSFAIYGDLPLSMSFPSGHTSASTATYFILAVIICSMETRQSLKALVLFGAATLTLMIGCSRVYLGVHWPSDVIAGWCLGAVWALVSALWMRSVRRPASRLAVQAPTPSV